MDQEILIVPLCIVAPGMGATALLALFRGNGRGFGHLEQVLQFQRLDPGGVIGHALVVEPGALDAPAQVRQLGDALLHEVTVAEHAEVVLHGVLQLLAQDRDTLAAA